MAGRDNYMQGERRCGHRRGSKICRKFFSAPRFPPFVTCR